MKSFGSILDFTAHRNAELMRAWRFQIARAQWICMPEVARAVVEMPAARFWVSEKRAAVVISRLLAGRGFPSSMRPSKREMFSEIYRRFLALRESRPGESVLELVSEVVNSPAPKFYMLPRSAMDIIYKIRNGFYDFLKQ